MWEVRKLVDNEFVVLTLGGQIEGGQLMELQQVLASECGNQPMVLDLTEVKLVDQDAVTFLSSCEASGTELRNCSAHIREWITRARTWKQSQE